MEILKTGKPEYASGDMQKSLFVNHMTRKAQNSPLRCVCQCEKLVRREKYLRFNVVSETLVYYNGSKECFL